VRLVEDHGVALRQQLPRAFVAQHDVGEEQVVVHHHNVRLQRLAPRLEDEALLVIRALLAQAVLAGRGHLRPDRRVLGHVRQAAAVASQAGAGVTRDPLQVIDVRAALEAPVAPGALEVMVADVIGTPLEQGDAHRHAERLAHHGQVTLEQLVLEGLGTGGDDHLAAGQQRGHEVGEGLAGTGAGLCHQHGTVLQGVGHRARHLELLRTHTEARDGVGQRAVRGEGRVDTVGHAALGGRDGAAAGGIGPPDRFVHAAQLWVSMKALIAATSTSMTS